MNCKPASAGRLTCFEHVLQIEWQKKKKNIVLVHAL